MSSYLAPTYFPPSYFASTGGGAASGGVAGVRDRDVYEQMKEDLEAIGALSEVIYLLPGLSPEAADRNPILGLMPRGWEEVPSGDGSRLIRTVRYQVWIIAIDQEPLTRYDWCDRLACLVQNRLDGSSLGARCLPALSVLRRGTLQAGGASNSLTVVLDGEFGYEIDPSVGRGTQP